MEKRSHRPPLPSSLLSSSAPVLGLIYEEGELQNCGTAQTRAPTPTHEYVCSGFLFWGGSVDSLIVDDALFSCICAQLDTVVRRHETTSTNSGFQFGLMCLLYIPSVYKLHYVVVLQLFQWCEKMFFQPSTNYCINTEWLIKGSICKALDSLKLFGKNI